MKNYFKFGFLSSLGIVAYISLVAFLMIHGSNWFFGPGNDNDLIGPIAMLLLFTISAAIVGLLVFGKPIYLFLNSQKKEGLTQAVWTIGCLIVEAAIIFIIAALTK